MRVLVTGATGYVGSRLVSDLLRAGHEVVATARTPEKLKDFDWFDQVQPAGLDVLDAESVRSAIQAAGAVDAAYYLVHALGEGDYEASDEKAARVFSDAAAAAGIGRIIYLGGFVPADGRMSPHLASRSTVGEVLRDSPVDTVMLQAAVILGAGSTSFEIVRHLVGRLPLVPLPRFMRHTVQPIAIDDVLHYLVAALDPGTVPNGTYDVAGDEQLTYAELARLFAQVAGLHRIFVPVPFVTERLAARVIGPLVPVPSALVTDLVQSLAVSMTTRDRTIRTLVPDPPGGLTTLRQAVDRALQPATSRHAGGHSDARPGSTIGTHELDDPLTLADTDASWAGEP